MQHKQESTKKKGKWSEKANNEFEDLKVGFEAFRKKERAILKWTSAFWED